MAFQVLRIYLNKLKKDNKKLNNQKKKLQRQNKELFNSKSWKITKPLRKLKK